MLHKWFPQMEDFEARLKKYRTALIRLEEEKAALAEKAAANSENKIRNQLEIGKLQNDLRERR